VVPEFRQDKPSDTDVPKLTGVAGPIAIHTNLQREQGGGISARHAFDSAGPKTTRADGKWAQAGSGLCSIPLLELTPFDGSGTGLMMQMPEVLRAQSGVHAAPERLPGSRARD
jgi:hypothetical protein